MRLVRLLVLIFVMSWTIVHGMAQDNSTDTVVLVQLNDYAITADEYVKEIYITQTLYTTTLQAQADVMQAFGMNNQQITNILAQQQPYADMIQALNSRDLLGYQVLETMIEDLIIQQQADKWQIEISVEQYNEAVFKFFSLDANAMFASAIPTPVPEISPTPPTDEAGASPTPSMNQRYDDFSRSITTLYDSLLQNPGVTEAAIRAHFERQALRDIVKELITADIGPLQVHVNSRHILVDTEAEALTIIDSLKNGADFAEQARQFSTDTGSGSRGGDLGWYPTASYVQPYADAVTTAPIGEIVGPVESQFGFHVIEVLGREDRYTREATVNSIRNYAFDEWLKTQRDAADLKIDNHWVDYIPRD